MNTSERSMQMRIAAHKSWALTKDRAARTQAARRRSHHDRFVEQARDLHPDGTEKQIAEAAEALKTAFYQELALKSAQSRRIRRDMKKADQQKAAARLLKAGASTAA